MAYLSNLVIISTEPETGEITPLIVSIYGKPGNQFVVVHLMFHYPMSLPYNLFKIKFIKTQKRSEKL